MDQSTKKKPVRSAAGKEKRASCRAVWLKGQRYVYMQAQVHEQWKLLKANGKLKNDSELAAYVISLERLESTLKEALVVCSWLMAKYSRPNFFLL